MSSGRTSLSVKINRQVEISLRNGGSMSSNLYTSLVLVLYSLIIDSMACDVIILIYGGIFKRSLDYL